jgi:hypothetical protein
MANYGKRALTRMQRKRGPGWSIMRMASYGCVEVTKMGIWMGRLRFMIKLDERTSRLPGFMKAAVKPINWVY